MRNSDCAYHAFADVQRSLKRLGETLLLAGADHHPVHHRLDGVFLVFLQVRRLIQFDHGAVDACTHITLGAQRL